MAFILYLFENRDVRNGRKEQNTGTELNGVSPATMQSFYLAFTVIT